MKVSYVQRWNLEIPDTQTPTGDVSSAPCKQSHYTHTSINLLKVRVLIGFSGYTAVPPSTISPTSVSVSFIPSPTASDPTPLRLLTNGEPEAFIDEERASVILAEEDLEVEIDLGGGNEEAKVWTCDFSHVSALFLHSIVEIS